MNVLTLPPPTLAQCQAETSWAMTTYPVSGAANVRLAGTFTTGTPLNDPRSCPGCCSPNWGPLLQTVDLLVVADQALNPGGNWVYYGIVNGGIPVNVPGCSGVATGGLAGQPITYAHEIGHQFGLPHARCGNAGSGNASYPIYEPYDLPQDPPGTTNWTMASTGEYGLDINNGSIANPGDAEDFMSYCGPRWISLYTHNFLVNHMRLVPQVIPTGGGAAAPRVIRDDGPSFERPSDRLEPLVNMLGRIDGEGNVEMSRVVRLESRYLVERGTQTDYVAQLVDEDGRIIAQDPLYRYGSEGCGNGANGRCEECEQNKPFFFKAMLDDRAPGRCLRIVRAGEVVWERTAPARPPRLANTSAKLDEDGSLRLTWELERHNRQPEVPEDVWIRWSDDEGRTWRALTVGAEGGSVTIPMDQLPSGQVRFQVLAHDGFFTTSETTDSVELPSKPPVVSIFYPKDSDRVYAEKLLHLWGTATSHNGDELPDEQFVWRIDGDEVGRGRDIWVGMPGAGRHEVRFEVTDRGGTGSATSSIEVP